MVNDAKLTEADYFAGHGAALGFPDPPLHVQKNYEFNMRSAQSSVQAGSLMTELVQHLSSLAETYAGDRPNLLYYPAKPSDLSVLIKPFQSVLTKIYRVNYLHNQKFPDEPDQSGFVRYDAIYDHPKMNDLLRARLVCKYMDGPQVVVQGLQAFCQDRDLEFRSYPMNSDMGYYAWHCYMRIPLEIMIYDSVENKKIWFELQVTTQLAEVITGLTHGLYEGQRVRSSRATANEWRWRPKSQQFRSAYLGHTLHLLEGVIQTFRDEVLGLEVDSGGEIPIEHQETLTLPPDARGSAGPGAPFSSSERTVRKTPDGSDGGSSGEAT